MTMEVAGGIYHEWCDEGPGNQPWDEILGSGLRAAAAIASHAPVRLHGYVGSSDVLRAETLAASRHVRTSLTHSDKTIGFSYAHALATPTITPSLRTIQTSSPLAVTGEAVLRFGMLEGTAIVTAGRAVYDPQSAFAPEHFMANGSSAREWVLVANQLEMTLLTAESDPDAAARSILSAGAHAVVVKRGARGLSLYSRSEKEHFPAFRSERVWPIGTGDVFSAVFAHAWARLGESLAESVDLASRAVSSYVEQPRLLPVDLGAVRSQRRVAIDVPAAKGRVYLAGPFFDMPQRWLVNQCRLALEGLGCPVFSPLHDVGHGSAADVVPADLAGLENCTTMLALVDGCDAGTVFEIGYARARGMPVVVFTQREADEPLKMLSGTGCQLTDDFSTAIYHAAWSAWGN